jgi:DNA-directed RNA polymerase specialized sigma24 family protein
MSITDPWAAYARLQGMLKLARVSDRGWALEETMNALIDEISEGREVTEIQIENLVTNRSAKYRHRRQYDQFTAPDVVDGARSLDARVELHSRLKRCSIRDQSILIAIGGGVTTREIALGYVTPEGTVKTWVHRARMKFAA